MTMPSLLENVPIDAHTTQGAPSGWKGRWGMEAEEAASAVDDDGTVDSTFVNHMIASTMVSGFTGDMQSPPCSLNTLATSAVNILRIE